MGLPVASFPRGSFVPGNLINGDYAFFDDFLAGGYGTTTGHKFASTANVAEWLYTALTGTPTFIISDAERGGVLAAATGAATDNHGLEAQLNGEAFSVNATKDMYFEARFKSQNSVTAFDWLMGWSTTETSMLAAPSANFIGFSSGVAGGAVLDGGVANIIARSVDDQTAWTGTQSSLDTGADLVADTFTTIACWVKGSERIIFYVDGVEKYNTTTNIPDAGDALTFAFAVQNNGSTQGIMEIDYIYVSQER